MAGVIWVLVGALAYHIGLTAGRKHFKKKDIEMSKEKPQVEQKQQQEEPKHEPRPVEFVRFYARFLDALTNVSEWTVPKKYYGCAAWKHKSGVMVQLTDRSRLYEPNPIWDYRVIVNASVSYYLRSSEIQQVEPLIDAIRADIKRRKQEAENKALASAFSTTKGRP